MEVAGEVVAKASPENTYLALTDPDWLQASVPGIRLCEAIDRPAPDDLACRIVWEIGLSMARIKFSGRVGWKKVDPPRQLGLSVAGSGSFGELDLYIAVTLRAEAGSTRIVYQGHGEGPEPNPTWKSKALDPVAHLMVQKLVESLADAAHRV